MTKILNLFLLVASWNLMAADSQFKETYYLGRMFPDEIADNWTENYMARSRNCSPTTKISVDQFPYLVGFNKEQSLLRTSPVVKIERIKDGYFFTTMSGSQYAIKNKNFKHITNLKYLTKFYRNFDIKNITFTERLKESEIKEAYSSLSILNNQEYKEYRHISKLKKRHFLEAQLLKKANIGDVFDLVLCNDDLRVFIKDQKKVLEALSKDNDT